MTATRRLLVVGGLMAGSMLLAPATSFAANDYTVPSQIPTHAQCGSTAGSGAFGYFGPGNSMAGGADGRQTGLNNSALCGNR